MPAVPLPPSCSAPSGLFLIPGAGGEAPPCSSLAPTAQHLPAALTSAPPILVSHTPNRCPAGHLPPAQDTHYLAESLS